MDDVVAVSVRLTSGDSGYFMTFGRVHDQVDPSELIESVRRATASFALGSDVDGVEVCRSLSEARNAPYFYEGLSAITAARPKPGENYLEWSIERRNQIDAGRDIWFLGVIAG